MARTENVVAKSFASTTTVIPVFVAYTSNERLFKHTIPSPNSLTHYQTLDSHADESVTKKRVSSENLLAIRSRFLEAFVHKTPHQAQEDLDACQTFGRDHFILGCFDRAMETLEKYAVSDFHSLFLPSYILSALNKNLLFHESVMCQSNNNNCSSSSSSKGENGRPQHQQQAEPCASGHRERLQRLCEKFNVTVI
jgi:hypothetical protein